MPLIQVHTNAVIPADRQTTLLEALSRVVAEAIGKPEQYVMATVSSSACLMSARPGPAAFVDIRSIGGLDTAVNQTLAREVSRVLGRDLQIQPDRVYLNFTDVPATHWGWNNETFG